jgi:hypothetical protein
LIAHLTRRFAALLHNAVAALGEQRRRRIAAREIEALDAVESGRIMKEAGLSSWEFRSATLIPFFSEDLLSAAIRSMGINAASFRLRHGSWHKDMQRACIRCQARKQCRRGIASHSFARDYWRYCLNAESLSDIVASRTDVERQISA